MSFAATQMDPEIKRSKSERQIPYIIYMWSLKYNTNEPTYETGKKTHRRREETCV